jgi:thiol-disulfide isomerase/thioredoxin
VTRFAPDPDLPIAPDVSDRVEDTTAGRVGYGRFARFTPVALGVLIAAALVFIVLDRRSGDGGAVHRMVGKPAPDVATTTWDGDAFVLADQRGRVVVLNFWAEWCAPCKSEMPAFQAIAAGGDPSVVIIGVDIKTDQEDRARDLVAELGITYPILRDAGGDDPDLGSIEQAFGSLDSYPMTVFIRPDGMVDAVRIGEMDLTEIEGRITEART